MCNSLEAIYYFLSSLLLPKDLWQSHIYSLTYVSRPFLHCFHCGIFGEFGREVVNHNFSMQIIDSIHGGINMLCP